MEHFKDRPYAWDDEGRYKHYSIIEPVGYWRKANHIHNWFVENVQNGEDNCGEYKVSKQQLEDLLFTCKAVLSRSELVDGTVTNGYQGTVDGWEPILEDGKCIRNPQVAQELLPTTRGCFFGSQDYDQWYYWAVESTVEILERVLKETDFENEVVIYSSSW